MICQTWSSINTCASLSKRDDTSTGTATRAAQYGSLLEGLGFSYAQTRWTKGFLSGSGHQSVKPYVHWWFIAMCVALFKSELNFFLFWCLPGPFTAQGRALS
jgi:hypothetical protein